METNVYVYQGYIPALIFLALFNTGTYLIADKMNIVAYYETYKKPWMWNICQFCLFFWAAIIELSVLHIHVNNFILTLVYNFIAAVIMAVISRKFL